MADIRPLIKYPGMQLADSYLTEGLVGAWAFAEGGGSFVPDLSGFGGHATAVASPTWQDKLLGREMSFNGSTQYLDVGNRSSVGPERTDAISWVYFGIPNVLRSGGALGYSIFGKYATSSPFKGYRFALVWTGAKTQSYFYLGNTYTTNMVEVYGTADIVNAVPTCVAATYNGASSTSGVTFYYNGVVDAQAGSPAPTSNLSASITSTTALSLGSTAATANNTFKGSFGLLLFYRRVLQASEIRLMTFNPNVLFDKRLIIPTTGFLAPVAPSGVASHDKTAGFLSI